MDINILPADIYILNSKTLFTDLDRKLITMLYQPIIGSIATSLYFTFWSQIEITSKENTHYNLMVNMSLGLDSIKQAMKKLEAIGLLKTYFKDGDIKTFVYEVYAPLSAYDFMTSPILNTILLNTIGKTEYEKVVSYFKNSDFSLDGFKEVTHSFNSVFKISKENNLTNLEENIQRSSTNKLNIELDYDIKSVLSLIPDEALNKKSITRETLNLIKNLSFVYNLTEECLKQIIMNSIDVSHRIDTEILKRNAQNYYEFNNSGKLPGIVYKNTPDALKSKVDSETNKSKMIYTFDNTSPYDFLASKYKDGKPTKTELKLIEYLLTELKFTPGVVNVLVDYVLRTNDNKLTKGYVEVVAGQWKRQGIKTVIEAVELAKKEYKNKAKTKKVTKTSPEWLNKKIESRIATKEEEEQMAKMLKELVGE